MDLNVESVAKAIKQTPEGVPSVDVTGNIVSLGYPTLAAYESRCSADDAAIRKVAKVLSSEVDGTHTQGKSVAKFKCA